jgi:hypothetical protein
MREISTSPNIQQNGFSRKNSVLQKIIWILEGLRAGKAPGEIFAGRF